MNVDFIDAPYVYTSTGERLLISQFEKQPIKGSLIELDSTKGKYVVKGSAEDNLCGNGQCPVK